MILILILTVILCAKCQNHQIWHGQGITPGQKRKKTSPRPEATLCAARTQGSCSDKSTKHHCCVFSPLRGRCYLSCPLRIAAFPSNFGSCEFSKYIKSGASSYESRFSQPLADKGRRDYAHLDAVETRNHGALFRSFA